MLLKRKSFLDEFGGAVTRSVIEPSGKRSPNVVQDVSRILLLLGREFNQVRQFSVVPEAGNGKVVTSNQNRCSFGTDKDGDLGMKRRAGTYWNKGVVVTRKS